VQTKAILYHNLWNFAILSQILFRVRIAPKKFTQVPSYVVCTQVRRHIHKQITEKRYRVEKQRRFVLGKPVFSLSLWDLLRLTPWVFWSEIFTRRSSLCQPSFGWDLSPRFVPQDWKSIFYSSLLGPKGRFVCVWDCLTFFVGEYSSVWPEICRVLSQIKWRFLRGISGKNYFGRIFQKFCVNQDYPLPKLVKFRPTFWNFIPCPYCAEKNSQKYLHILFAPR